MSKAWPKVPLGEVLTERIEQPSPDDIAEGRVRVVEKISFDSGVLHLRVDGSTKTGMILVQPGDLLVSGINAAKGAIAIYDKSAKAPIAATIHYGAYSARPNKADVRFLWWLLRSRFFQDLLLQHVPGGIKTELKAKRLLPVPVPLPPLAEQRRVVARIEELAGQIEEADRVRQQATEGAEALIASQTSSKFDHLSRHPKRALRTLGVRGADPVQTGPFGAQLHASDFVQDGVPVLNVGNVWPDGLRFHRLDHVLPEKAAQLRRYSLEPQDLLFARSGATLGKVCLVPKECNGWLMTGHLFRIRFDQSKIMSQFAFAALRGARSINTQVFRQVRGATRPGYNTTLLGRVEIPVPPLDEQRQIVDELNVLQNRVKELRQYQTEVAAELDALLPAILDRAFKGELC